jgi:hypothetical protein
MTLECGNAAGRKTLTQPFLQCTKCKATAYCSKEYQVPPHLIRTCCALRPSQCLRALTSSSVTAPITRPSRGRPDTSVSAHRDRAPLRLR